MNLEALDRPTSAEPTEYYLDNLPERGDWDLEIEGNEISATYENGHVLTACYYSECDTWHHVTVYDQEENELTELTNEPLICKRLKKLLE